MFNKIFTLFPLAIDAHRRILHHPVELEASRLVSDLVSGLSLFSSTMFLIFFLGVKRFMKATAFEEYFIREPSDILLNPKMGWTSKERQTLNGGRQRGHMHQFGTQNSNSYWVQDGS